MINTQILTLIPQDQLALVNGLEVQTVLRYRRLALRFINYSTALSWQMAERGIACEQHLAYLREVADRLGLGACVGTLDMRQFQESASASDDTLFIVAEDVVNRTLQQALANALESHRFARRLLAANGTPELERPLWDYAQHKHVEANVLLHCCASHVRPAMTQTEM